METIVVKTVEGPNDRGWFTVELEDGRSPTTKDKKLAELAFKHRDTQVKGEIGEKVNGKFTNVYLNKIEVGATDAQDDVIHAEGGPAQVTQPVAIPKSRDE